MACNAIYILLSLLMVLVSANRAITDELDLIFTTHLRSINRLESVDMEYVEKWKPKAWEHVVRYSEKGDMFRFENNSDGKMTLPGKINRVRAFDQNKFQLFEKNHLGLTVRNRVIPKARSGNIPLHMPYKYIFVADVLPDYEEYYNPEDRRWDGNHAESIWNALKPYVSKIESGEYGGHACKVIEFDFPFEKYLSRVYRVHFAKEYDYYPIKVEIINKANGIRVVELVTNELTGINTEGGLVYVPTYMINNQWGAESGYPISSIETIVDKDNMLINEEIPDELFTVPPSIAKEYSDEQDRNAYFSLERQGLSGILDDTLVGKSFVDLIVLGITASQIEGDRGPILACFFDMEQRPSRNCVLQLAKRQEQLKKKGVSVVIVQCGALKREAIDDWMVEQAIPFVWSMLPGGEDKIRTVWGIKTLPWMALTDKNRTIRYEGFGISEIDEKIRATNRKTSHGNAFLDASFIYNTWKENYTKITSMKVVSSTSQPGNDKVASYAYRERIDEGKRFHMMESRDTTGHTPHEMTSFDGEISMRFNRSRMSGSIRKGLSAISGTGTNIMATCLHTDRVPWYMINTLHHRPRTDVLGKLHEYYPQSIDNLTLNYNLDYPGKTCSVRPELEMVSGEMCHVIDFTSSSYWFAHEKSMLVMKSVMRNGKGQGKNSSIVREIAKTTTNTGDLWYPREVEIHNPLGQTVNHTIVEFTPYVTVSPDVFKVDFPVGTRVRDMTAGVTYGKIK